MAKVIAGDFNNTSGNVEIEYFTNGVKRKKIVKNNNTTFRLTDFLVRSLRGDNTKSQVPQKIVCVTKDSEGNYVNITSWGDTLDSYKILKSGENYADVQLIFMVDGSNLSNGTVINGFSLYNGNGLNDNNWYAQVTLGDSSITVNSNTYIKIKWVLRVSYSGGN